MYKAERRIKRTMINGKKAMRTPNQVKLESEIIAQKAIIIHMKERIYPVNVNTFPNLCNFILFAKALI